MSAEIWKVLSTVLDPEVPAISVVDLGIVRDVVETKGGVEVVITPTYSGCPAMAVIEEDILTALRAAGYQDATVKTVLSPPWSSDWISPEGKAKLRDYGIAPPQNRGDVLVSIGSKAIPVPCPFCKSEKTSLKSEFGSTACKALYFCSNCQQPFEYFKEF